MLRMIVAFANCESDTIYSFLFSHANAHTHTQTQTQIHTKTQHDTLTHYYNKMIRCNCVDVVALV